MLVVDASYAVSACLASEGFEPLRRESPLVAPPLLWPEARSSLHVMAFRGETTPASARGAVERLDAAPIDSRAPAELGRRAWQLADDLGWAKTYDAEYVALALILACRVVTLDQRLHRRVAHLGVVVAPGEL